LLSVYKYFFLSLSGPLEYTSVCATKIIKMKVSVGIAILAAAVTEAAYPGDIVQYW